MEEQQELINTNKSFKDVVIIKSDDINYIVGRRRVGKSYLMEKIAEPFNRYVVYDGATAQHGDMGIVVQTIEELKIALPVYKKIVFQPLDDSRELFDQFCQVIWEVGNIHIFVEEIGNYIDGGKLLYFDRIVRMGRNRGIGLTGLNQRPRRVSTNFVAVIDHWFIFNIDFPDDIDFLRSYIGKEKAEQLKSLPKRYFFYKNDEVTIKCNPI